jgi:hypothetical protein
LIPLEERPPALARFQERAPVYEHAHDGAR